MYLTKKTKDTVKRIVGKSVEDISKMDMDEELALVESKIKRPVVYSTKPNARISSRGNPLIVAGRIKTMDEINKRIAELM